MNEPIGIIGVGLVGGVIADRLAEAGYPVSGHDPATPERDSLTLLPNADAVFQACDTVLLSLPNSTIAKKVLSSVGLRTGQLIIDTTTGTPEDAVAHAQRLTKAGASYLEATIAGSSDLLSKQQASIFLGGDPESIARAQPLLDVLTTKAFPVGGTGKGAQFKLMFNLILGLQRAVLAEALCFGDSQGIDPETALEILRQTPAYSSVMDTKGPRMVEGNYDQPQARLSQHLKDVRLILERGATTPLSALHRELLEKVEALGFGDKDNSAILEAFRKV